MTLLALIHPLAKSEPIVGVIFFVIWGIIVLMSKIQQYRQKQQQGSQPGPTMQLPPQPQLPPTMPQPSDIPQAPLPHHQQPVPVAMPHLRHAEERSYKPRVAHTPVSMPHLRAKSGAARRLPPKPLVLRRPAPKRPPLPAAKVGVAPTNVPAPSAPAEHDAYEIHNSVSLSSRHMDAEIGPHGTAPKHMDTPPAISAAELTQILRPGSLRKAYILSEILRRPE